jgi:CubicO group peptidase (beta-lactamase class C family)
VVAALSSAAACDYVGAFGVAATEPRIEMHTGSVFRIASMTKLVTSVAVLMLADDGLIDLDEPLRAYLPDFVQPEVLVEFDSRSGQYLTRRAARDATLRELLSHTGGYGYWFLNEPLRIASGKDPDLFDPPFLMGEPGRAFAYSTSTDVVGRLVEPVSGLPLDRFFEERIFAPLGMGATGFALPADSNRLVRAHRRSGKGFRQLPLEQHGHPVRGGGGLYSTAADYSRLLRCLLRGGELDGARILSESSVSAIASNQIGELKALMQRTALANRSNDFIFMDGSQKFGFGVMIETEDCREGRSAGSYSWAGIFNTYFWVDPARDLAAVLMLQLVPFASRVCVELYREFETAVYEDLQR